ncbi:histidine phosphatase family protein [Metabacillus malikii]|uniref:Broad specificity phosphatase PhoE n=1 Tax=Metabacillus malikii TaxID=1504265 RepID=A0ABT9ZEI5_9BACI|nr:histidine phosphatase family protein [Metabacillus malikii]MDQ0230682.1 broad specificity phosphatase PhoE [Metabacillus malikii]
MNSLIFIQHCQSEHHINNMSGCWTDTPITDTGRKQAKLIGDKLIEEIVDIKEYILYSSDLSRAVGGITILSQDSFQQNVIN